MGLGLPAGLAPDVVSDASFKHQGELTWRLFPELAHGVRRWLDEQGIGGRHRRRIYSTFIEMTYNILHHAAAREADPAVLRKVYTTIALGKEGKWVWIAGRNFADRAHARYLTERLARLAALSRQDLALLYRAGVASSGADLVPPSNNAGLGLITIVRDVARPLEYSLRPSVDSELFTFTIKAYLEAAEEAA